MLRIAELDGAMVMQRKRFRRISLSFRCGLTLFLLTPWNDAAIAQPKFLPLRQYPGPWLEITQEVRDFLALHKVSACNQAGASIVAKFRRISFVLHSRRKILDKLACAAAGAQSARSRQASRRHPAT